MVDLSSSQIGGCIQLGRVAADAAIEQTSFAAGKSFSGMIDMEGMAKLHPQDEGPLDPGMLNAALEAFPLGLAIAEKGRILYANRGFAQRFGVSQEMGIQGRAIEEFVPELSPDRGTLEASGKRKNVVRQAQASVAEFKVNGRNLLIVSAPVVSQGTSSEQQSESFRMEAIGRLVSGVAHDFNNLLTGIMLYCDLLLAGLTDNRMRHHAEEIRMAGEHGAELIQQLMAVARRESIEPRWLSWNQAVSDMRNLLGRLVGENIELVTDLAEDLNFVKTDPARAHQIILNLVLNARDAMPDGGRVTLSTRKVFNPALSPAGNEGGAVSYIEFAVNDTGLGMDEETRSHLFEPFFTTKMRGRGNGLGLATVKDLIQQLGGSIEVESAPDQGTRVVVHLPCAGEQTTALGAAASQVSP
jgi:signal transduction histidine kinase